MGEALRGDEAATELVAGSAGTPRGSAARGHHTERSDRGTWFERRHAFFVSAGTQRFPVCSRSDYCTSFRYRPHDGVRSYRYTDTVVSIRTRCVLPTLREIGDFSRAVRTRRVLTTLPDDVRQAARIPRILAPSRESVALSNDSESRTARRRRRLEPGERAARRRIRLERDGSAVPRPASRRRACRERSGFRDPSSEHYRAERPRAPRLPLARLSPSTWPTAS